MSPQQLLMSGARPDSKRSIKSRISCHLRREKSRQQKKIRFWRCAILRHFEQIALRCCGRNRQPVSCDISQASWEPVQPPVTATRQLVPVASNTSHLALQCIYNVRQEKTAQHEITISQKCANIFVLNFSHLFRRQLYKSVLLCAVFTWHTPKWRKCKLQERILQLY